MLKKLDESLPLAETSSLANADLAGRFYLACRGVPDYLMTLVRGAAAEALQRGNEQIEMDDLARIFERCLAQQRVLAEQSNPFIGDLDKAALDRVQTPIPAGARPALGTGFPRPRSRRAAPQRPPGPLPGKPSLPGDSLPDSPTAELGQDVRSGM